MAVSEGAVHRSGGAPEDEPAGQCCWNTRALRPSVYALNVVTHSACPPPPGADALAQERAMEAKLPAASEPVLWTGAPTGFRPAPSEAVLPPVLNEYFEL